MSRVKRLRISLGTLVAVEATGDTTSHAEAALEAAFAAITQVERRMHPWAPDSDLARINSSPLRAPTPVHPTIGLLLGLARQIHTLTHGVFDPCLPIRAGRITDIEVSADGSQVVCHEPVALDFGGFAKGYAVDCAIETLMAHGCSAGLVNAGGDLRAFGPRVEPMFVRGPRGEFINVALEDAALAVSDANSKQRPLEHQGYYVRDLAGGAMMEAPAPAPAAAREEVPCSEPGPDSAAARGGAPSSGLIGRKQAADCQLETAADLLSNVQPSTYAAVIASTAVIADALAKCVMLCPPHVAARALHAFSATQLLPTSHEAHTSTDRTSTRGTSGADTGSAPQ